jgi:hypothetical protein
LDVQEAGGQRLLLAMLVDVPMRRPDVYDQIVI